MTYRRTGSKVRAVGMLTLLALVGCKGGNGGGSLPFSQFDPTALQAVCRLLVLCGEFPDQATCMASDQEQPHLYDTLNQDISASKVTYDGAKAQSCIDMLNALPSCNRSTVSGINVNQECNTIFTGTVAGGGACFFDQECASATCQTTASNCDSFTQCCAGSCLAVSAPVAVGGDCSAAGATCVSGAVCVVGSSATQTETLTCLNPGGAGAACTNFEACDSGLYCDSTSETCKTPVATGGACNPTIGSSMCDSPKDYCDTTTMVCTPLLAVGSPCTQGTPSPCVSYATCDATTNTCLERPAVGAACDTTGAGPSCLGGSCDATTAICTLDPTSGACS
jgi:hypothetical protein